MAHTKRLPQYNPPAVPCHPATSCGQQDMPCTYSYLRRQSQHCMSHEDTEYTSTSPSRMQRIRQDTRNTWLHPMLQCCQGHMRHTTRVTPLPRIQMQFRQDRASMSSSPDRALYCTCRQDTPCNCLRSWMRFRQEKIQPNIACTRSHPRRSNTSQVHMPDIAVTQDST
jgi:hypothetical protein